MGWRGVRAGALVLLAMLSSSACLGSKGSRGDGEPRLGVTSAAPRGLSPSVVYGTVVEASTGEPRAGVLVEWSAVGVRTRSDDAGRFVLQGLPLGVAGVIEAHTDDELVGRNRLRPLDGEPLEVVIYLR